MSFNNILFTISWMPLFVMVPLEIVFDQCERPLRAAHNARGTSLGHSILKTLSQVSVADIISGYAVESIVIYVFND